MYPFKEIESRWQKWWTTTSLYRTSESPKKKYYVLEMFSYPSGDLHMGHLRNYVIVDLIARYKMMQGFDVLHPVGWDAFGLPAENAAIRRGIHPKEWTLSNIELSRRSLRLVGIGYDWDREILTCTPSYYKWTQWIFLLLYKKGLAYRKPAFVNWCPDCQTVLANEQVEEGKCWRCHSYVTKKKLTQWFFKITDYAERLLNDIDKLDGWPDQVKELQRNWIGRSEGVEINFELEGTNKRLPVFTTRPDTIYGVTFLSVAPEHPILEEITKTHEVNQYIERSLSVSEIERASKEREKTGVFTGKYAINLLSGDRVPIFVCDYVLASYGTGIVMGVPAHDQRDFEFAHKYGLPIKVVVNPKDEKLSPENMQEAYEEYGIMVNSGPFTGLASQDGIKRITEYAEQKGIGGFKISYRLRDWLISRQRYWGAPIPMIHCERCGTVPVPEEDLPVLLPERNIDFTPKGKSPLAAVPEFISTECPVCGGKAKRDSDTIDTFVDSSWYQFRYADPHNDKAIISKGKEWLPVDQYVGGIEHATGHLIYFRFITKVLYDEGIVPCAEPVLRLFNHGMIKDEKGQVMSSSRGNVVPVGSFVEKWGADTARVAILFLGPPGKDGIWSEEGVHGANRFLNRVYRLINENKDLIKEATDLKDSPLYRKLNITIKRVTYDLENFGFNTALAALMEFLNVLYKTEERGPIFGHSLYVLIKLLAPFAPHLSEELWHTIGNRESVFKSTFPAYDEEKAQEVLLPIVVQVNGKVRARFQVPEDTPDDEIKEQALSHSNIKKYVSDKKIERIIFVPRKLINIVCK